MNDEGRFEPEYAEVYGVPFAFIPATSRSRSRRRRSRRDRGAAPSTDRDELRIDVPEARRLPRRDPRRADLARLRRRLARSHIDRTTVADLDRDRRRRRRARARGGARPLPQYRAAAGRLRARQAHRSTRNFTRTTTTRGRGSSRSWSRSAGSGSTTCVTVDAGLHASGMLLTITEGTRARRRGGVRTRSSGRRATAASDCCPMLDRFDPVGSTDDVDFLTRKARDPTRRSRDVNHVVLDGADGNTWEQTPRERARANTTTSPSYVKNDHLGFTIPYVHEGRSHELRARLPRPARAPATTTIERTLIVEVSGGQKSHSARRVKAKADTARDHGAPRSTTTAASAAGATSRSTDTDSRPSTRSTTRSRTSTPTAPIIGDPDARRRRRQAWRDGRARSRQDRRRSRRSRTPTSATNIPTADAQEFVDARGRGGAASCATPRDPSLDPQLVWKGKDEQDARRPRWSTRRRSTSRRRSTPGS